MSNWRYFPYFSRKKLALKDNLNEIPAPLPQKKKKKKKKKIFQNDILWNFTQRATVSLSSNYVVIMSYLSTYGPTR